MNLQRKKIEQKTLIKDIPLKKVKAVKIPKIKIKRKKVLKLFPIISILDFIIKNTSPKPIIIMWKWIKERLAEPSTYQGFAALTGAIGIALSPEMFEAIVALVTSIVGLVQIAKKEKAVNDK